MRNIGKASASCCTRHWFSSNALSRRHESDLGRVPIPGETTSRKNIRRRRRRRYPPLCQLQKTRALHHRNYQIPASMWESMAFAPLPVCLCKKKSQDVMGSKDNHVVAHLQLGCPRHVVAAPANPSLAKSRT